MLKFLLLSIILNMHPCLINVNGQMLPSVGPSDYAKISVFDRSFLFGDSVYEVIRTYQGKAFRLKEHLKRLETSAKLCQMTFTQSLDEYEREINRTIAAFRELPGNAQAEVYIRFVVSRGSGKIGFSEKNITSPTLYVVYAENVQRFLNKAWDAGFKLKISERMRNPPAALDPAAKTGNYLNSLLAFLSAEKEGYDDAILLNSDGHVTEGTTFNIFYVTRGIVATPPLDIGILAGISRELILDLCKTLGISAREVRFPAEYLLNADEVFASVTTKEVFPITEVNGKKIGHGQNKGRPGPITQKLQTAFQEAVRKEIAS